MRSWVDSIKGDRVLRVCAAAGVLAAATLLGVATSRDASVAAATAPDIVAIKPARVVDTRVGESTADGRYAGDGRIAAGREFAITIAGRAGVPAKASAVVLNVTAVRPKGPGYLTVFPCGTDLPTVSNVNYEGGDVAPNAVLAKLGPGGQVCVFSLSETDLVIDVNAYVPEGGTPVAIDPVRNFDSRSGQVDSPDPQPQRLHGGTQYRFKIGGKDGVPKDAEGAIMNITAVRPDGPGFVTVYPCGLSPKPNVSSINYNGGDVAPNAVLAKLGTNGQVCVISTRDTDLLIDVNGYVPVDGAPVPVEPVRFADTRPNSITIDGNEAGTGRLTGGREYRFNVGARRVSPGFYVKAAMMNITAVRPDGPGHITVYPCGIARPNVSSINYNGGDVAPNAVFSRVSDDGYLCVYSVRDTDLIIDVSAFVGQRIDDGPVTVPSSSVPDSDPMTTTTYIEPTTPTTQPPVDSTDPETTTTVVPVSGGCVINGREVQSVLPAAECNAMVDLYNSMGGPGWTVSTRWNTPTDPCTWYEVVCDKGKIDFISLIDNNLTGSIPASIGDLDSLDWFNVSDNKLSGPVPKSILNLRAPWVLRLRGNGCFTAEDQVLAQWLDGQDPQWNDGC